MADLLRCPFCGENEGKTRQFTSHGTAYWQVRCEECWATSHGSFHLDEAGAVGAWNTRSGDAPTREAAVLDPTAMTGPLTKGQQIVADYERDMIAEPCELATAIDQALAAVAPSTARIESAPKDGVLVPCEPTTKMFGAFISATLAIDHTDLPAGAFEAFCVDYRAMLAVAPQPSDAMTTSAVSYQDNPICPYCDHQLSCGHCGVEVPDGVVRVTPAQPGDVRTNMSGTDLLPMTDVRAIDASLSVSAQPGDVRERVEISDEDMRDLLSSKDVGSGRAKLRRLLSLKSTAAFSAPSAAVTDEWRDISTAPKVGLILIAGGVFKAENSMAGPCVFDGPTIASYDEWETAWKGDNCGGHDEFYWHMPTHWMPLPAPPVARNDRGSPDNG